MKTQGLDISSFNLPHSPEAEKAVIGMLLIESTAINEVSTILSADTFYNPSLALIYTAIVSLTEKGERPDMVGVVKELVRAGKFEEAGGGLALSELTAAVGSAVNVLDHSMYIHQLYLARKLAIVGQMISAKALDRGNDVDEVITESLQMVEQVADKTCYNANAVDLRKSVIESVNLYKEREERSRKGLKTGIPTGLEKLDKITGGWMAQQLVIIAARPAMEKTAFMLHAARAAAAYGVPTLIFSLEMSVGMLTDRMVVSESDLKADRFKNGYLSDNEMPVLCDAAGRLSKLPVVIDDTTNISIQQIKARAKNLQRKGKCGLVMIDYLQLIDVRAGNKSYNREQEIAQCTRSAKNMSKELNIPVILLSQLSREVEKRADKTPILSDLRESGAIEQDADIVLFIHRPEYYDSNADKGSGVLRIGKQRDGQCGDIKFRYNESLTRIADYDVEIPF